MDIFYQVHNLLICVELPIYQLEAYLEMNQTPLQIVFSAPGRGQAGSVLLPWGLTRCVLSPTLKIVPKLTLLPSDVFFLQKSFKRALEETEGVLVTNSGVFTCDCHDFTEENHTRHLFLLEIRIWTDNFLKDSILKYYQRMPELLNKSDQSCACHMEF